MSSGIKQSPTRTIPASPYPPCEGGQGGGGRTSETRVQEDQRRGVDDAIPRRHAARHAHAFAAVARQQSTAPPFCNKITAELRFQFGLILSSPACPRFGRAMGFHEIDPRWMNHLVTTRALAKPLIRRPRRKRVRPAPSHRNQTLPTCRQLRRSSNQRTRPRRFVPSLPGSPGQAMLWDRRHRMATRSWAKSAAAAWASFTKPATVSAAKSWRSSACCPPPLPRCTASSKNSAPCGCGPPNLVDASRAPGGGTDFVLHHGVHRRHRPAQLSCVKRHGDPQRTRPPAPMSLPVASEADAADSGRTRCEPPRYPAYNSIGCATRFGSWPPDSSHCMPPADCTGT